MTLNDLTKQDETGMKFRKAWSWTPILLYNIHTFDMGRFGPL